MLITTYSGEKYCYSPRSNLIEKNSICDCCDDHRGFLRVDLPYDKDVLRDACDNRVSYLILGCTEHCNMRCKYCTYGSHFPNVRNHSNRKMLRETGDAAIRWLKEHSSRSEQIIIGFYGGEPMTEWENIKHWISFAKSIFSNKKISFNISSNGSVFPDDFLTWMKKDVNLHINITMNGIKEIHDRNRLFVSGKPTFDTVYDNVMRLRKCLQNTFNEQVLLLVNYTDFSEKARLQKWLNSDSVWEDVSRLLPIALPPNTEIAKTISRYSELDNQFLLWKARCNFVYNLDNTAALPKMLENRIDMLKFIHNRYCKSLYKVIHPGICTPFASRVFVDVNGNIFQCERTEDTISLGNVMGKVDYELVNDIFISKMQKLIQHELKCHLCPFVRLCRICFSVFLCNGGITQEQIIRRECAKMRSDIKRDLEFYISVMEKKPNFWECLYGSK